MKVLHVTDSYRPATGGLERAVSAMAHATRRVGHHVDVVTLARPDAPDEEFDGTVRVRRVQGWSRHLRRFAHDDSLLFHPTAPDPAVTRQLRAIVAAERPDVIHAHGWMLHSALALRPDPGRALVVTLHDYGLHCAKKSVTRYDRLDQQCAGPSLGRCLPCAREHYGAAKGTALVLGLVESRRRLDRVHMYLPISQAVADASLPGVGPDRVRIVPPFVPDGLVVDPGSDDLGRGHLAGGHLAGADLAGGHLAGADPAGDVVRPDWLPRGEFILFVGAMSRHKGVDTLVAAHRRLARRVPLVLLGPAHSEVGDIRAPDVIHHPAVPPVEVAAVMRAAAVVVVPSRWPEPLGLVAVEAMAIGRPVIASNVGGLGELVSGAGLVVPAGHPDALAAGLDALLNDPGHRDRLGRAGRTRARQWSESAVVPRLLAAYAAARANAAAGSLEPESLVGVLPTPGGRP